MQPPALQQSRHWLEDKPSFSTYGLATQLRTPPEDQSSSTVFTSSTSPSTKLTPAMRDEIRQSPRSGATGSGVPTWSASSRSASSGIPGRKDAGGRREAPKSGSSRQGPGGEYGREGKAPESPPTPKKGHSRSYSSSRMAHSDHERAGNTAAPGWTPNRPPRPADPTSFLPLPVPSIPNSSKWSTSPRPSGGSPMMQSKSHHGSSSSTSSRDTANKPDVDFSFAPLRPLDLGIKIDPGFSTYHASKSSPSLGSPDPDEGYKAQVGVAARVSRGTSISNAGGRKASVAMIVNNPQNANSHIVPPMPRRDQIPVGGATRDASQIRPPRPPSDDGSTRPIGQGLRSSYSGSIPPPTSFRRSSSVYIPNPSAAPPPAVVAPPSRLPMNLLTLARRTSHLSGVPGYGWRLHLLEKLEVIMGSYLTIGEAEEILSIGNGAEAKPKSNRSESRKSLIGMPPASPRSKTPQKTPTEKSGGFFGKMKRNLFSDSHAASGMKEKDQEKPKPAPAKTVFGQPLAVVAEYGFVTSMIAGQRHDLPGVVFGTVEEIYRRGQGSKIPGLLHLAGEPARIAKLTSIYDSAPDYGEHHDLSIESIHNVTSLLKKYLRELPEPVLDHRLWRLYLAACLESSAPMKQRVACAQIILRLLPAPNFSLLVYLIAFLSQMPLFPENRLTLESVSIIFGPAAMSVRGPPSTAAKLTKLVAGTMVITGPTDTTDAVGLTVKKAQDGLLWLLNNWSAVADGLLEPDFDVDTDVVLDRSPAATFPAAPPLQPITAKAQEATSAPPAETPAAAPATKPDHASEELRSPAMSSSLSAASSSPSLSYSEQADGRANGSERWRSPSPTQTLEILANDNRSHDARSHSPSSSRRSPSFTSPSPALGIESSPSTIYSTFSPPQPAFNKVPQTPPKDDVETFDEPVDDGEDRTPVLDDGNAKMEGLPASESSRSSDSTLESSVSSREKPAHPAPVWGASIAKNKTQQAGFARARPEDEFGPLGPPGSSVLDDLLDTDADGVADSSLYNFPTPPSDYGFTGGKVYREGEPRPEPVLVRTKGEMLREAQQIQETQRREIQTLWKQLTDNELARATERSEAESLRQEVAALKAAAGERVKEREAKDEMQIAAMEARCREAKKSMEEAREQLRLALEEKEHKEEEAKGRIAEMQQQMEHAERDAQDKIASLQSQMEQAEKDARGQITSLQSQLDAIRSLLMGGARA
ncbi:Rho GTPase-activating protein [Pseudohyphozyma bogoriensis]|nr:Rho GTPase-activating protein [Pseudohyphozyma bogoriensis]